MKPAGALLSGSRIGAFSNRANSSVSAGVSRLACAFAIGAPLGTALAVYRFPGRGALIVVANALLGLPPVVVGLVVYLLLSRSGPLGAFGILFTPTAMVIAPTFGPLIGFGVLHVVGATFFHATSNAPSHHMLAAFGAIPVAERVVRDGNLITGGGITAGIDFALTVAADIAGEDTAKAIQLEMEYNPQPPFDAGSPESAGAAIAEAARAKAAPRQLPHGGQHGQR